MSKVFIIARAKFFFNCRSKVFLNFRSKIFLNCRRRRETYSGGLKRRGSQEPTMSGSSPRVLLVQHFYDIFSSTFCAGSNQGRQTVPFALVFFYYFFDSTSLSYVSVTLLSHEPHVYFPSHPSFFLTTYLSFSLSNPFLAVALIQPLWCNPIH